MYSVSRLPAEKQSSKPLDSNGRSFTGNSRSVVPDCDVKVEQEAMVGVEKVKIKRKIDLKLQFWGESLRDIAAWESTEFQSLSIMRQNEAVPITRPELNCHPLNSYVRRK